MAQIKVIPQGKACWPDLGELRRRKLLTSLRKEVESVEIAGVGPHEVTDAPMVVIRMNLADGRVFLLDIPMRNFVAAADAMQNAHLRRG